MSLKISTLVGRAAKAAPGHALGDGESAAGRRSADRRRPDHGPNPAGTLRCSESSTGPEAGTLLGSRRPELLAVLVLYASQPAETGRATAAATAPSAAAGAAAAAGGALFRLQRRPRAPGPQRTKPRGRAAGTDRQRRRRFGHISGRIPCRCPGILCDQPGCGPGEARRAPPPPAILGDSARIGRTPALGPRQRDRGDGLLTDKSPSTMATPPPPPRTLEFPARLPSPACALGTLMCRCCINAGRSCAYPSSCFTPLLYACWAQILQSFTGIAARWRPAGRRFRQLRKVLKKKVAQVS